MLKTWVKVKITGLTMNHFFHQWGTILINKISLEPAFVLHTRAFQETSIIVDFYTILREAKRYCKRCKKTQEPLRSVLTPASKLSITLSGKNDLKTLSSVEIIDHYQLNSGTSLNSIIYVNELITKATEKEDPHVEIFKHYEKLIINLSDNSSRRFGEGFKKI